MKLSWKLRRASSIMMGLVGLAFCTGFGARSAFGIDPRLAKVNDWLYVLQHDRGATPSAIAASGFDLVVMDYSADGTETEEFSSAQIAAIKASGKVVLAYLSIGEAEIQRFYWNASWNDQSAPDPDAPGWLGPFNPAFPDNFKVRYWEPAWQALIFGTTAGPNSSYLDRILDQGFDGVYLDIIDAFEFWSEERGERSRMHARSDMIDFVIAIADHARNVRGARNFIVFPQNGATIIQDDGEVIDAMGFDYLAAIDGIGAEDTFYDELNPQPPAERQFTTVLLDRFREGGSRLVLAVDYVWNQAAPGGPANVDRYNDFQTGSLARGYIPYAAVRDRDLDEILTLTAEGDVMEPQPKPPVETNAARKAAWRPYR